MCIDIVSILASQSFRFLVLLPKSNANMLHGWKKTDARIDTIWRTNKNIITNTQRFPKLPDIHRVAFSESHDSQQKTKTQFSEVVWVCLRKSLRVPLDCIFIGFYERRVRICNETSQVPLQTE